MKATKLNISGTPQLKVHISFFGDFGRRSWIPSANLLPYTGRDSLEAHGISFKGKKPSNKFLTALDEADKSITISLENRLEQFKKDIEQQSIERFERIKAKQRESLSKLRSPTPESPAFESLALDVNIAHDFGVLEKTIREKRKSEQDGASRKRRRVTEVPSEQQIVQSPKPMEKKKKPVDPEVQLSPEERIIRDFLTEEYDASLMYASPMKKEPVCRICFEVGGFEGKFGNLRHLDFVSHQCVFFFSN